MLKKVLIGIGILSVLFGLDYCYVTVERKVSFNMSDGSMLNVKLKHDYFTNTVTIRAKIDRCSAEIPFVYLINPAVFNLKLAGNGLKKIENLPFTYRDFTQSGNTCEAVKQVKISKSTYRLIELIGVE